MKHTKDPTQAEQERFFLETWERENAGLNGRHTEKAPRKRYARRPGPPKYFRAISPTSGRGRLLEAARTFPGPFGETALVLAAWALDPLLFGLRGLEGEYPSDRRVTCLLYGGKGLIARGLIEKCEGGLMRVVSPPG